MKPFQHEYARQEQRIRNQRPRNQGHLSDEEVLGQTTVQPTKLQCQGFIMQMLHNPLYPR